MMTLHLYLNEKVRELPGFESKPYKDKSGYQMNIDDISMFGGRDERLYFIGSENIVIPEKLKGLVEEISCYESIPQMSPREPGVYRHGNAECELVPEDYGKSPLYRLKLKAKCLEDLLTLRHQVKIGTIRPDESYAAPQCGKTRKELEQELLQTQQELAGTLAVIENLQRELSQVEDTLASCPSQSREANEKIARLRTLERNLEGSRLPFVSRTKVAARITEILDKK